MSVAYRQNGGTESSGGSVGGGSSQVTVSQFLDSSGGAVNVTDSANNAINVNVVAGAAAGSTLVTVRQSTAGDFQATVTPVAGSTWRTQPGSTAWASSAGFHFDSSGALQIVGTFSASTTVNISSLAGPVIVRSSAADHLATVYQSSAADLNVTVAGYVAPSTVVTVSTGSVRVHQSTAADLNVTVAGYSTTVNVSSLAGTVETREIPASTVAYGQVVLGSTAVQIVAASTVRTRLVIVQHSSSVPVFLGASTVTSTSGVLLQNVPGNQFLVKHSNAVYGISTGGSPVVSFMQETRG